MCKNNLIVLQSTTSVTSDIESEPPLVTATPHAHLQTPARRPENLAKPRIRTCPQKAEQSTPPAPPLLLLQRLRSKAQTLSNFLIYDNKTVKDRKRDRPSKQMYSPTVSKRHRQVKVAERRSCNPPQSNRLAKSSPQLH